MLKLREIEIFGFKSFADRTRIPLPDDLLVVVGPNGSGKSNVTDAVLWALGEQSAKTLRGHKMQDVIFVGSHRRPGAGMAEVLLTFEEQGGPKTQLGRRLLRTGESAYLMDGRPVRLKDVQDFMMRYGISTHGSFLVEQGRVEGLLAASPEERRMVFEEVAGIVHYKENRRSALQKLEATEANLLRLNDVITEVETQMSALKRQAQRADRFVRLSEELRSRRRAFWGRSFGQLTGRRSALAEDLELMQREKQRRETALSQLEASLEESKVRLSGHETSLQQLIQRIHERELERERVEQENRRKTEQILSSRQRMRQIATDREQLAARIKDGQKENQRLEAECKRLEKSVREAGDAAEAARLSLEESKAKVEALEAAQEILRQKAFGLAQEHSRLAALHGRLEEDLRKQAEREKRLAREQEALAERERASRQALERAEERKAAADTGLEELVQAVAKAQETEGALRQQQQEASARLGETRQRLAVAEGGLKLLGDHEASLRSSAHAFLAGRDPQKVKRTLAEGLDRVPEALVAPLTSALGDLLEGYLGSAWDGLAELLGELAMEKAGQAVFFLDDEKVMKQPPVAAGKIPGFRGWLHEAEGMPGAIAPLLPLVALVEDDDGARRFAKQAGLPAVSPEGLFVHPDGWVRGGSGGRGGGSLLEHQRQTRLASEEVETLRIALAGAEAASTEVGSALGKAAAELVDLKTRSAAAAEEATSAEWEQTRLEDEARRLSAQRDLLEGEAFQVREEREVWEKQRGEVERLLRESEASRTHLDGQVRQGEKTIASGREAQEAAHEAVAASRERQGELTQREKGAHNALKKAAEFSRDLLATEGRLSEEAKSLEAKVQTLSSEVTEGDKALKGMLLALEESRERRAAFEEDLRRLAREVEGLEAQVREAREALEEVRGEASKNELALASVDADLRNLVERMGEVFEEGPEALAGEFRDAEPLSEEERADEHRALSRIEERIQELGAVNMLAREEYAQLEERFGFLSTQRTDLETSVASLQETIRKINRTTRERFMEAFDAVQGHFGHLFREVFEGGEARLTLLDEANPLETGVEIYAQPPGKKLQNMLALSGGEKAMVALALLFSLFLYRPQPFFLLDEVDAPLDEANINRFSRLLLRFQGQTQFVVVSHNKRTMELAEVLYGVTMVESGVSRLVAVRLADIEDQLRAQ